MKFFPTAAPFLALALAGIALPAAAQQLDMTKGGPIEVTSSDGIEWRQSDQVVIARGDAKAVRDGVTLTGDRLLARYRPRAGQAAPATSTPGTPDVTGSSSEIWRMEAEGNVHINSATDQAQGDRAVYDIDRAVMVLTGKNLQLNSPENRVTARDSLEYWPQKRMAVARGAATVTSKDGRRITADVLVAYFLEDAPGAATVSAPATPARPGAPPAGGNSSVPGEGSKLDRVEAFGNVEIRTTAEVVRGDRGVYSPVTGMARILGNVRITRGQNQLHGQEAIVNMHTNVARLVAAPGQRVQGVIMPGQVDPAAPAGSAANPLPTPQTPTQPTPSQPGRGR